MSSIYILTTSPADGTEGSEMEYVPLADVVPVVADAPFTDIATVTPEPIFVTPVSEYTVPVHGNVQFVLFPAFTQPVEH